MARLSHHDLQQMDEVWQDGQSESVVRELLKCVLNEFRVTLDHLSQTPNNSSRPSGSMPLWQRTPVAEAATAGLTTLGAGANVLSFGRVEIADGFAAAMA